MNPDHNQSFSVGEKIKLYRLAQNLTQEELAVKVGIITKYLSLIETGKREASIHVYQCIADVFGIPMWYLFCDISDEALLVLTHFDDCTEMETRALGRFIAANKEALRQNHKLDLGI